MNDYNFFYSKSTNSAELPEYAMIGDKLYMEELLVIIQ